MKKIRFQILIPAAVLLLLAVGCFVTSRVLAGRLDSQRAAERWAGEGKLPFAQLSCFMGPGDGITPGSVYAFRQTLTNTLAESDLDTSDPARLFVDAFSARGSAKVSGDHGSADAAVTAVGGDYFLFHPLRLLSGSYIREDDLSDDRVVLDRELAWRLFGGEDLEGMTVTIGADPTPYVVAGVVERERDFATRRARGEGMDLYMSFRAYSALTGSSAAGGQDSNASGALGVDCYELVMPQPVKGYAEGIVKEQFKLTEGEILNNTERYSLSSLWQILRAFGSRSMHLTGVVYPYWENAARCLGDWCTLFFALALVFGALPVLMGLLLGLGSLIRLKDYLAKKLPALASDAIERSRRRRYRGSHLGRS